jgi:hypothetical protein
LAGLAGVVIWRWPEIKSNFGGPGVSTASRGTGSKAQRDAAKILEKRKILVIIETPDPARPNDKLVTSINFCGSPDKKSPVDKEVLDQMANFPDLQSLNAADCRLTGEQLKYLAPLTKMASLVLSGTSVDDAGLANLQPLTGIESLHLKDTAVTDAGLDHVAALTNLKVLDLSKTKITDAGVKKLQPLANLKWLLMSDTAITDAGLQELAAMQNLGRLTITETKVTPEGVAKLKQANGKLSIDYEPPKPPTSPDK